MVWLRRPVEFLPQIAKPRRFPSVPSPGIPAGPARIPLERRGAPSRLLRPCDRARVFSKALQ